MTSIPFPQPVELPGLRRRWRLSDLERYEDGETERTSANEIWLSASQVGDRYSMSRVSVWNAAKKAREEADGVPA